MAKLTSRGEAWAGNWYARLISELGRCGCRSLREFAAQNGLVAYSDIAAQLDGPFVSVQMVTVMRREFLADGDPSGFVADCLSRYLVEYVTAEPDRVRDRERQAAEAVAACGAAIGEGGDAILMVWSALKDKILDGWLPNGPLDSVVRDAVGAHRWQLS